MTCSERTESVIEDQSENKTIQVYLDFNVILQRPEYVACCESLRRANPQQSNDQREEESISCQAWRVFVTVWLFLLLAGRMRNLTEETLFLLMPQIFHQMTN